MGIEGTEVCHPLFYHERICCTIGNVQGTTFIDEVLKFMGVEIEILMVVNVENMGEIFLSSNVCGKRMKHIDTRFHFILDYVENGTINIFFVPMDMNR